MSGLYNMDQHSFAAKQYFIIEYINSTDCKPYMKSYVSGFSEVLQDIPFNTSLTIDEMFRIFIDNRATSHSVIYLDDNGDVNLHIKIIVDKRR
jgi:hypothetical protein